jgi:hypothetical protein
VVVPAVAKIPKTRRALALIEAHRGMFAETNRNALRAPNVTIYGEKLSDDEMEALVELSDASYWVFDRCQISAKGLRQLSKLKHLAVISVVGSDIDLDALVELMHQFPGLNVKCDWDRFYRQRTAKK